MSGRKRNESEGGLTLLENSRRDRRNWMDPWEHSRRLNREHPGDYYRRRMKLSQLEPTCSSNSRKIENWTRSRNILKLAAKIRGKMKWKEKWNELETIGSFGSIVSQRRGGGNETVRHFSEGWDFIEFGSEKKKKESNEESLLLYSLESILPHLLSNHLRTDVFRSTLPVSQINYCNEREEFSPRHFASCTCVSI